MCTNLFVSKEEEGRGKWEVGRKAASHLCHLRAAGIDEAAALRFSYIRYK